MENFNPKKNRLDLEYKFESQKALIFISFGTISLIGFIAVMIIQKEYWIATVLGFIVIVLALVLYSLTKKKMNILLKQIENLK